MSFENEHAALVAATNAQIERVRSQIIEQLRAANVELVAIAERYDAARQQLEGRYGLRFKGPSFAATMRNNVTISRDPYFKVMTAPNLPGSAWAKVK